jgi:hypothetical protein
MKKVLVAAMAVALAVAMCVPASAFENEFGGYWRTRAYTNQDFSGDDNEGQDLQQVDTRTRLYYTAKFSDDFKFVNKFEFDAVWGDSSSYGDIGADGVNVEIKNSYVDYNLGNLNVKIGTQAGYLSRGLVMDDDFSGAVITGNFGDISVPFYWIKINEGGIGPDKNDDDRDAFVIAPVFKAGAMEVNPFVMYVAQESTDLAGYNVGLNLDAALDNVSAWFTGIYQGGDVNDDVSFKSYLVALGGGVNAGGLDIHGQMFYASGDDNDADDDHEAFADLTGGQSYYWAEIMGYGVFDEQVSSNSCADKISDIMAFNIGASMSPVEKLTVGADIWYAMLAEDDAAGEDYLGTELDLTASYKVIDNLTLDVVAAYLFAGDATGEEDPMELGAQLSLSF